MEIRGRILVTVLFVEARVGLHGCKVRSGIPEIVSLSVVGLGQIRSTFVHVARYFTPEVMLQFPLISALKSVKKACTETIKYFPIGACDYEIVK